MPSYSLCAAFHAPRDGIMMSEMRVEEIQSDKLINIPKNCHLELFLLLFSISLEESRDEDILIYSHRESAVCWAWRAIIGGLKADNKESRKEPPSVKIESTSTSAHRCVLFSKSYFTPHLRNQFLFSAGSDYASRLANAFLINTRGEEMRAPVAA